MLSNVRPRPSQLFNKLQENHNFRFQISDFFQFDSTCLFESESCRPSHGAKRLIKIVFEREFELGYDYDIE